MIINSFIIKPVYDTNAQAFITAAGLTDFTQINAVNTLVLGLKSASLWTKIDAIYPMVGGTATAHKFNLKNPLDTNAAFRLSFLGGWTQSSTGAQPGVNGYIRTYLTPSVTGAITRFAYGIYSRTQNTTPTQAYGSYNNTTVLFAQHNLTGANFIIGSAASSLTYTATPTTRFIMARRDAANLIQGYRDGTSLGTSTTTVVALPNVEFFLGARSQDGVAGLYSTHEIAFAFIAGTTALTNTDAGSLTTLVNSFQLALGRNV
jgi:hypothetical protein